MGPYLEQVVLSLLRCSRWPKPLLTPGPAAHGGTCINSLSHVPYAQAFSQPSACLKAFAGCPGASAMWRSTAVVNSGPHVRAFEWSLLRSRLSLVLLDAQAGCSSHIQHCRRAFALLRGRTGCDPASRASRRPRSPLDRCRQNDAKGLPRRHCITGGSFCASSLMS